MLTENTIQNIEPYNELFHVNCFYNSFFSVLTYYRKSLLPFLINDIATYTYDTYNGVKFFSMNYLPVQNFAILVQKVGLHSIATYRNANLIEDTIKAIDNNNPVIININCYYMPIKPEDYFKNHRFHSVLIYGYDNSTNLFQIFEQKHVDTLSYDKTEISYSDLLKAYEGLQEVEGKPDAPDFYSFALAHADTPDDSDNYTATFIENIKNKFESIQNGLHLFQQFAREYKLIYMDEASLKRNIHSQLYACNKIINIKKVERTVVQQLFGNEHDLPKLLENIEGKWNFIRLRLAKYSYSSLYRPSDFMLFEEKLNEIQQTESTFYQQLLQL